MLRIIRNMPYATGNMGKIPKSRKSLLPVVAIEGSHRG